MNKFIKLFFLTLIFSVGVFAQSNGDAYQRNEFYVGYSNQQADDSQRRSLNGFDVSYVRNFHRYLGIKGDFSAAYKTTRNVAVSTSPNSGLTTSVTSETTRSLYNVLGGLQLKDNGSKKRLQPFVHLLAGVAVDRNTNRVLSCSGSCAAFSAAPDSTFTHKNLSGAIGGGLDIKVNNKFSVRAFQVDYNPIYQRGRLDNVRLGAGIVF